MKKLKKLKISTAIETNATNPLLNTITDICDIIMIDFKHPNKETLKSITVGCLDTIKQNIVNISVSKHIHIRIPLIHGFNDSDEQLIEFTQFFKELKAKNCQFDIELLPYHEYGKEKWEKCNKEYTVKDAFVSKQTLDKFKETFKQNGIAVINT